MGPAPLLHEATGAGAPIVLVPGGLSGWVSWAPFVAPLATDRQVVRVQLRSVELAEAGRPSPPDYGTPTEREALRATADALGLGRFDLVGWSYGGHVALAFALAYPRRVRTLTLIEPDAPWLLRALGHDPEALARAEARDRALAGRAISAEDFKGYLIGAGLGRPGDAFEAMPGWPVWLRNRQVLSVLGTMWDYAGSLDRLRALDAPVLVVKGTETTGGLAAAVVGALAATLPRGRLLELPGGHASHIESMDRFLAELAGHTATVRA